MIDLGVATSVAKNNNFSWQDTVDFASSLKLNSIQFYIPQNRILPQVSNLIKFENIYLHIPNDYDLILDELILFTSNFKKLYDSDKLIIHQKESLSFQETKKIAEQLNCAGLQVGIENEGTKNLYSYLELIEFLSKSDTKFYIVLDIHRFYFNYVAKYKEEVIFKVICQLLDFCSKSKINMVLHVIDSKSFKSNRSDWVPLFEGIIPYSQLFKYISTNKIDIESIIFEYESYLSVTKSLENLKKIDYNSGKNQPER